MVDASYVKSFFSDVIIENIAFERGLGIVEPKFIIYIVKKSKRYKIEIEADFRVRTDDRNILSFNDLYLDLNKKQISVRKFRSQKDIEKTYLSISLKNVNNYIKSSKVIDIDFEPYGDLYIYTNAGLIIEIFNDTHEDKACIFRILEQTSNQCCFEVVVEGEELISR